MPGPTIVLCDYATAPLGCTVQELAVALQSYCDHCLATEWGVGCKVEVLDPPPAKADLERALVNKWGLLLLDTSDQADAEGYHLEGDNGEPRGFAFIKTSLDAGDSPTVTVSHEFAEMLCDPTTNRCVSGPHWGQWTIVEVADPVEASDFTINGIRLSNFVMRAWYTTRPARGARFDWMGRLRAPFTLEAGGYTSTWDPVHGWNQHFASKRAMDHFLDVKAHKWSRHSRRMAKYQE